MSEFTNDRTRSANASMQSNSLVESGDLNADETERYTRLMRDVEELTEAALMLARENGNYLGTIDDLSNQIGRLRVEARAGQAAKEHLLQHLSHEIRTPLTAVIGLSELIKSEPFGRLGDSKYREYIGDIHESGLLLLEHFKKLLDMSNVEAVKVSSYPQRIHVEDVVNEAVRLAENMKPERQVDVTIDIDGVVPSVWFDRRLLIRILAGIIENGLKYGKDEENVSVVVPPYDGETIEIHICDKGLGMTKETISTAFDMMGAVDPVIANRDRGLGVSLAYSKRVLEMFGGSLSIKSHIGSGTTVSVFLPPLPNASEENECD